MESTDLALNPTVLVRYMTKPPPKEVTQLLIDWSGGDKTAFDKLVPLVYEELRRLAHRYMSRERAGHTLQTTALVNEAYFRLVDQKRVRWQCRRKLKQCG